MGKFFSYLIPLFLVVGFVVAIYLAVQPQEFTYSSDKSLRSAQQAAVPLGLKVHSKEGEYIPEVDSRVHLFSGFTRYIIPQVEHFDMPMGTENGAFSYNAQGFFEPNKKRGGFHLGDDLNGIGGMNSDFGDAVYAVADGLVVYSGEPSAGWGNVIIVAHKLRDGRLVQSFYSHLEHRLAFNGMLVGRGEQIGTVGNAKGRYLAHLHFEMRESYGVHVGGGYSPYEKRFGEQIDPTKFMITYNKRPSHEVGKSALTILKEQKYKKRIP